MEFGKANKYNYHLLQCAMATPEGMQALLAGAGKKNNQFSKPPFQYAELKKPGIRAILNSYDVLGGKTTYNLIWTTTAFHSENPKTYKALLDAFSEAMQTINSDKRAAAETYLKISKDKSMSADEVQALLEDPQFEFTTTPRNMMKIVDFMHEVGHIKVKPVSWKDMFFPEVWNLSGS